MGRSQTNSSGELDLAGFEGNPGDQGLSLDDLSESFAKLLGQGESPYEDHAEAVEPQSVEQVLEHAQDDDDWPVTPKGIVESILFVGHPNSEPISARYIASLMRGVRANEVVELIGELNADYARAGSAYRIEPLDNGFRLVLRAELSQVRDAFMGKVREAKLTQAAIDVLAVVAYQQPISKQALDEVLGKSAGRIAGQLIRRGLLEIARAHDSTESDGEGKAKSSTTLSYQTTDRFLSLFGLDSLQDLPTPQDLERL